MGTALPFGEKMHPGPAQGRGIALLRTSAGEQPTERWTGALFQIGTGLVGEIGADGATAQLTILLLEGTVVGPI